ncbi:MAG: hypothetical protein H7Y43_09610, partial [Akkermansiaceae bacterium]|nr:hypothetical protein [Verrucomicrobiales bacterium]
VFFQAELKLQAVSARTRWAAATNLNLKLDLLSTLPDTNTVHGRLTLSAEGIDTKWSQAATANFTADWVQSITNAIPISGRGELWLEDATSQWGKVRHLRFASQLEPATHTPPTDPGWGWWVNLVPYAMNWECELRELNSPKIAATEFSCAGNWSAPNLTFTRISSTLYGGKLGAQAAVNVATRRFTFKGSSDFDVQQISPLLTEKSRQWISQFAWNFSPKLEADGSLLLPAWTNLAHANWHGEVRPSMRLDGHVDVGDGGFRGIRFSSAVSHFSYSNLFWRVPDLVARRPEGEIRLALISNEATRDYRFQVHSSIHPLALKPLLATNQYRIFDLLGFSVPPVIDGEIWGRWYDHESIGARAWLAVTNFTVHGETFDDAIGTLEYTNLFLKVIEPRAHRGAQYGSATSLDFDIPGRKIYITNAVGVADPGVVTRAIGPKVAKLMEPYLFRKPVAARVNGVIPMRNVQDADLHFELEGEEFEWWKFKLPRVSGRVHWVGETLKLRNMRAEFYRGSGSGDADFNFRHEQGTQFSFDMSATDADLHLLMRDLTDKTNRLEGLLNVRITLTDGNSRDLHTLQGSGRVELRDGLIWDIPIFGILSPVLDGIAPGLGLGSSRAREGTATFGITNGVVRSDDLEIRASMMRLQYWGAVDMVGNTVDARAQAELFRDTWMVGRLLSYTLWPVSKIFEYKFTGTLHEPKNEPVFFVPKILLFPFHPLRTLKDLAPELPGSSPTNAVPGKN